MVGREAAGGHALEELPGWQLGKVGDDGTRLVAQAVGTALLFVSGTSSSRNSSSYGSSISAQDSANTGLSDHRSPHSCQFSPQPSCWMPPCELDDQVAALGVGVLKWEMPLRETLAEALRRLVVVASSQEAFDRARV